MNNISNLKADQIGLVVSDIEEVARRFGLLLGIEGIEVINYPNAYMNPESYHHGKPSKFNLRLGFVRLGDIELEFIQPLEGENAFKEFLDENGPGLHHLRFSLSEKEFVKVSENLQSQGVELISSGRGAHLKSHWAIFDTKKQLGTDIELLIV